MTLAVREKSAMPLGLGQLGEVMLHLRSRGMSDLDDAALPCEQRRGRRLRTS